jgi:HSP20 family protein
MVGAAELRSNSAIWSEQARFGRHIQAEAAFSVEEPYRRRGIGEKLFKRIQRAATNHGVETIEIICLPDNVGMRMLAQKFKTHFTFEEGRLKVRLPTPLSLIREASGDMLDLGAAGAALRPFENLRREVDRLFEDFILSPFRLPFRRPAFGIEPFLAPESWVAVPAVDFVEKDNAYEVHADLPGIDEKDIEVKVANGVLTIKGQKEEAKEEKKEDYHLRERHYGSCERALRVPDTVDTDKIAATFKKGVLTVTLPKSAEAQKLVKKIEVKGE